MRSWPTPPFPDVPGQSPPLMLHDTSGGGLREVTGGTRTSLYVCGITPYDATHMGHAATYVTFDLVNRALRDGGRCVTYVQNITDIDDPLLERAARDGIDWRDLAEREIELFREDMTALAVIPPDEYVGVVESMDLIAQAVRRLLETGLAYEVPVEGSEGHDVYLDLSAEAGFGSVSRWTRDQMLEVYADRGGDPDREGKKDPLDPLLWRAAREGEPAWDGGELGPGRPGWHIECTAIAVDRLGAPFDLQGGGSDLVFPHHEMSAVQSVGLTGAATFAHGYAHQAMVGYAGEKMSKSRGNLVLVSALRAEGVDPRVIRLVLLAHHYREPWDWTEAEVERATARLELWEKAVDMPAGPPAEDLIRSVRAHVARDLDTPPALDVVDEWARAAVRGGGTDPDSPGAVAALVTRLLGVTLVE